jgi:hypothetical protein
LPFGFPVKGIDSKAAAAEMLRKQGNPGKKKIKAMQK